MISDTIISNIIVSLHYFLTLRPHVAKDRAESTEDSGDEECNDSDRLCSAQLIATFYYDDNKNNPVK